MAGPGTFILPSSPLDRRRLGKYEVVCRLSTGGMSQIYLAHHQGMGGFHKLVVLKTILPDIVGEEDFVRMFLDEARTTAGFNHPHIAQVYELDTADDVLFMAMEFVQGCTLVELARACRQAREPIPIGITLQAVRDTALALHYAHTFTDPRGRKQVVIHRDVAEKNIMVTYEGVTKLLDFGIAKALGKSGRTSAGMVKGTSGYMSPEQIRGEPLDPRSDLFSLGVVLHECLTGLRLFHGKNAEEGMMAALKGSVAPPSRWNTLVSPEVDAVAMKALSKDREGRHATALELARDLERAAAGAIWHPEESGALVLRHFADRRAETRRVLDLALGAADGAGEVRVETLIQRMKGAQAAQGQEAPAPPPALASLLATTQPAGGTAEDVERLLSRPRPPPLPPRRSSPSRPLTEAELEDASEAKTIPAAALPEEIKAIRARLQTEAAAAAGQARPATPPGGQPGGPAAPRPASRGLPVTSTVPPGLKVRTGEAPALQRRDLEATQTLPDSPRARGTASVPRLPEEPSVVTDPGARRARWVWAFVAVGGVVAALMVLWLLLQR